MHADNINGTKGDRMTEWEKESLTTITQIFDYAFSKNVNNAIEDMRLYVKAEIKKAFDEYFRKGNSEWGAYEFLKTRGIE